MTELVYGKRPRHVGKAANTRSIKLEQMGVGGFTENSPSHEIVCFLTYWKNASTHDGKV